MSAYQDYLERKQRTYGSKFDTSDLAPQFAPYLHSGQRIEVEFAGGEVQRGTVGVTTGWRPRFLLVLRRNALGSIYTLGVNDKVIPYGSKYRRGGHA